MRAPTVRIRIRNAGRWARRRVNSFATSMNVAPKSGCLITPTVAHNSALVWQLQPASDPKGQTVLHCNKCRATNADAATSCARVPDSNRRLTGCRNIQGLHVHSYYAVCMLLYTVRTQLDCKAY